MAEIENALAELADALKELNTALAEVNTRLDSIISTVADTVPQNFDEDEEWERIALHQQPKEI